MRCLVECRGETTWYCEECAKETLDKEECFTAEHLKDMEYGNI